MLLGRIWPPRAERMTGPAGSLMLRSRCSAAFTAGWMGMRRPERRFAIALTTTSVSPTEPVASRTIDQSSFAISQARRPALTESSTIARSRTGNGERPA
jgi:hypothetical protein